MLVHHLPARPTKLRVRIWRRLQALGAVPIKNSVYVLPFNEKTNEDFQWLKQEIESAGGEASLFRAGSIEGATDLEIVALFQKERAEEFSKLISESDGLLGAARQQIRGNSLSLAKFGQYEAELNRLQNELERILSIDFFDTPMSKKARTSLERLRTEFRTGRANKADALNDRSSSAELNVSDYQNRRWVTRKNPHIDRLASGWLIRRFIDKRPRFFFISDDERIGNALAFDMHEGEFTHRGEDCTFETMIKRFGLNTDPGLVRLAEVVHDLDLKDNKFKRSEVGGLGAMIQGLSAIYTNDMERLKQSMPVFDALYEFFRNDPLNSQSDTNMKKQTRKNK